VPNATPSGRLALALREQRGALTPLAGARQRGRA
jgi:hypothetical protein